MYLLEVIGYSIDSCIKAQAAGAARIELCSSPPEGGVSPSRGFLAEARKVLSIPLFCMVRPRGGDFLYSAAEFEAMKNDVCLCKDEGCDGVVTGLLTENGNVDIQRTKILAALAYPMEITFHRAFDRVRDPATGLEQIIDCGCQRILTSGLRPTATEGIQIISELVQQADDRIIIMPGSGVRASNVKQLAQTTGAFEFHTSAAKLVKGNMLFGNEYMPDEILSVQVDENEIENIIKGLTELAAQSF